MNGVPVTVLMPVYNASTHLREAIDSILNQTFKNFELLIINDGSTDNSEQIIQSYNDSRIRYVKNETNIRLIATLNKGIEMANGRYIVRMDADDISEPDRIQVQYDYMEQNPGVAICGSWFKMFGDRNEIVKYVDGHYPIMAKMLYQCHFCHPSVILRKEALLTFDVRFDPFFIHAEDYDFFTRIGERYKLANIQKVLVHYRTHAQSISQQNKAIQDSKSATIKKRLFEHAGIIVTDEELELYRRIGQYEYEATLAYQNNTKQLLEKMLTGNERTGYFDKAFFRNHLAELWFNVTYNTTQTGKAYELYFSSALSQYKPLGMAQRLKFAIKNILKK